MSFVNRKQTAKHTELPKTIPIKTNIQELLKTYHLQNMAKLSTADIDPETGKQIKDKIQSDLNPHSGLTHNKGKPKKAPHAQKDGTAAHFLTNCSKEHRDSLQCIERNYQNRAACDPFFQAYKNCRREENEKVRAENQKQSGGSSGGWFW
jgi:hypothetical protein